MQTEMNMEKIKEFREFVHPRYRTFVHDVILWGIVFTGYAVGYFVPGASAYAHNVDKLREKWRQDNQDCVTCKKYHSEK
jgi:hypothetical protein